MRNPKLNEIYKKPTIAELEAILNSDEDIAVTILPNGEVSWNPTSSRKIKACPRCKKTYLEEVPFFGEFCGPKCKEVKP